MQPNQDNLKTLLAYLLLAILFLLFDFIHQKIKVLTGNAEKYQKKNATISLTIVFVLMAGCTAVMLYYRPSLF